VHFCHYLKDTVDAIYMVDHRGHGRSEGLRCHVDRFSQYTDDCALAIRRGEAAVRKRFGEKTEAHVFAHSLGGLIALRTGFLFDDLPIESFAVSSPLLGVRVHVPLAKRAAARALSNLWGSLHMATEINGKDLSHDPEVAAAFLADRLVSHKITPRLYTEMIDAIDDTVRRTSGMNYPLFMMIPPEDPVVNSQATLEFYERLDDKDKKLKTYPGFYHEIFNEVGKDQVFGDLKAWIEAHRLKKSKA
jgi:alpha-beta hydrolase superfamily lysophospholipase